MSSAEGGSSGRDEWAEAGLSRKADGGRDGASALAGKPPPTAEVHSSGPITAVFAPTGLPASALSHYSTDTPYRTGDVPGVGDAYRQRKGSAPSQVYGNESSPDDAGDMAGTGEITGHRGERRGMDSPSKVAFDSFTTSRRPLSRSSSPSFPASRPIRSPSPLQLSVPPSGHPDRNRLANSNSEDQSGTEGAGSSSPANHPYLSLPRARSPTSLSDRSQSPVSPRSGSPLLGPHTAPPGSGSFGARREQGLGGVGAKKRPLPLDLSRGAEVGVDPELQVHMDEVASARSAKSSDTTLSHEMNDLSLLRNNFRQNLHERPLGSTSDNSESGPSEPPLSSSIRDDLDPVHTISADELHDLHASSQPHVILDCRSPVAFGQDHLAGSLNVSIPTLIVKRLKKGLGSRPTWSTVGSYIAGQDGKRAWESLDKNARVVLLGETGRDDVARLLRDVVGEMLEPNGSAQILTGGWGNLHLPSSAYGRRTVSSSQIPPKYQNGDLPPPRPSRFGHVPDTAPIPAAQPSVQIAPPTPPTVAAPRLANQLSMPSLRTRRAHDALNSGKKLPQLSLNVAPPLPSRATTLDPAGKRLPKSPGMLTINTGVPNAASPVSSPTSQGFPTTARKASFGSQPLRTSKARSFSDKFGVGSYTGPGTISAAKTPAPLSSLPARAGPEGANQHMIDPSDIPAGAQAAPGSARPAIAPFLVSTIIPHFLYLGPEILEQHEVDELQRMGIKRILNVAIECDDDSGLRLGEVFDRYHHIPMRDIVEEVNLGAGIKDAMSFLDDARLRDSPTYVHCKAGKSRSVTIVLAYLIHANAWTLKTAYSFVAERRPGISPNIGFVAELMQYAEVELGLRQHRAGQDEEADAQGGNANVRPKRVRARDSMPAAAPVWSSPLQDAQPDKLFEIAASPAPNAGMQVKVGAEARRVDEREIRREGAWVQHRRAPKDERLRPSRRVSKAGLETMHSPPADHNTAERSPSPHPQSTFTSKPATPLADGRASWL